jgi:hypothetical protein
MWPRRYLLEKFELPLHLILGDAVAFLDLPGQLVAFAGDQIEIIVCQRVKERKHLSRRAQVRGSVLPRL